ncbi:MAG: SUMF1/EgtB/PvdO family nonheme iron enzyme [Deltaproteobacteria bacterium]|nr:SUMF1/EgtB/PvdO family nonheme iron enzyme [Deltaproteobacteria bacterium]
MPSPGETICGEIHLDRLASASLGAEVFQPVFVARNDGRDESLWLTVIDGAFLPTHVDLSTFMAGANALTGIRHPSLVRTVLVDREENYCVVGYEELPGAEALGDLIIRGGSRRLLARAAVEVARGLAFLHRRQMLHGALTPGTVVLWEGVPVLWEYGLAGLCVSKVFGPRARSLGGDVVAPEVVAGSALTPASDVYAWGAVMASIASGELGSDAVAAIKDEELDPGRHAALFGLIRHALEPEPEQRPRDGVHLLELLQRSLSSIDPGEPMTAAAQSSPAAADSGIDALRDLASRYLEEMDQLGAGSSKAARPRVAAPPVTGGSDPVGALGRVQLVKRREDGGAPGSAEDGDEGVGRPWLSTPPIRERSDVTALDPRAEPSEESTPSAPVQWPEAQLEPEATTHEPGAPSPVPTPSGPDEPEWSGRFRLPSGTYRAIVDAPKPSGPGLVRGPEPGVSGADAGTLALGKGGAGNTANAADSSARWVSHAPETSASGWLRAAGPKAAGRATEGLYDARPEPRELAHGVRKRWILAGGAAAPPPSALANDLPPPGVPRSMDDEEVTPREPIDLAGEGGPSAEDSMRGRLDLDEIARLPPSERDTPPDLEAHQRGAEAASNALLADEDGLPPMPEPSEPRPEARPDVPPKVERRDGAAPFRVPRTPGPHGPPAVLMAVGSAAVAGLLALGATLAASSARGGFDRLWQADDEGSAVAAGDESAGDGESDPAAPADGCPKGMVAIAGADPPFCIDRAEYPGLDRVPAIDVDLPHARQACVARGHILCTEAQWRRACRGDSGWRFPYGPRREAGRCRVGEGNAAPGPAGADPHCVSPEGVLDLVGNVAEWTEEGLVMGGSVSSKKTAGCNARQRLKATTTRGNVGFRCCFVLPAPVSDTEGQSSGTE